MVAPHGAMSRCFIQLCCLLAVAIAAAGAGAIAAYVLSRIRSGRLSKRKAVKRADADVSSDHQCRDAFHPHGIKIHPARWRAGVRRPSATHRMAKFDKEIVVDEKELALMQGTRSLKTMHESPRRGDTGGGGVVHTAVCHPLSDTLLQQLAKRKGIRVSSSWETPAWQRCAAVAGDGNCYWRALSTHLHGHQGQWAAVKTHILRQAYRVMIKEDGKQYLSSKQRKQVRSKIQALSHRGAWLISGQFSSQHRYCPLRFRSSRTSRDGQSQPHAR